MATPSHTEYWEDFYEEHEVGYEWFLTYADLEPHFDSLLSLLHPSHSTSPVKILHIGCGNSLLCESLIADYSFVNVENIDVCENVIETMMEREKEREKVREGEKRKGKGKGGAPRMTYVVMDACKMTYADSSFDMVIDKGTIDAILSTGQNEVGENEKVNQLLAEVHRVLKPNSVFVIISRNGTFTMTPYIYGGESEWDIEISEKTSKNTGGMKNVNFIYTMKPCKS